jgi:hypothetical protein
VGDAELQRQQHGAGQRGEPDEVPAPRDDGHGEREQHPAGLHDLLGDLEAAAPLPPDRERRLA